MTKTALDEAIYQKYIRPTERIPGRHVGLEFEFPVINLNRQPVDFPFLQEIVTAFSEQFYFTECRRDDDGAVYSLTEPGTGDNLSFDCSYNTLEISFGKEENIHILYQRFVRYYSFWQKKLLAGNHTLTGMGTNPYYRCNIHTPIASERYRMLSHFLHSCETYGDRNYHSYPDFNMFCAASQVQLDVSREHLIRTLNTCNRLEPLKALLFANSLFDGMPGYLLTRDDFWRYSTQGYNPHNVDMYADTLHSLEELTEYIKSQSIYCVERNGNYLHFKPVPLRAYFSAEKLSGEYYADGEWRTREFSPCQEDLQYLRSFKFEDLTFRGTVEYRSACEQPVSEIMAHAAFHAGLAEQLGELAELLENDTILYGHGYSAMELRRLYSRCDFPDFAEKKALSDLLLRVLRIAEAGLKRRGFGEESFLEPLYLRAERLLSPARQIMEGLEKGDTIEVWIEKFAALS